MFKKESYVVIAAIVVAVLTMLFFPMTGTAGSLDPSAAPAPTMKTLDQIPPTWSQKITDGTRFQLVFGGAAVLDKETGLVWEQSPTTSTMSWLNAMATCQDRNVGNRKGWQLPTVEELASLVDPTMYNPALPSGHPFTSTALSSYYWSATPNASNTAYAWIVIFANGVVSTFDKTSTNNYVWCVRGGQGYGSK